MKSIISNKRECYRCHATIDLHKHHIFEGTANRKKSEQYGMWIYLCGRHHNMSNEGIHFDKIYDLKIKQLAQTEFEKNHTRNEFIEIFKKSYL